MKIYVNEAKIGVVKVDYFDFPGEIFEKLV